MAFLGSHDVHAGIAASPWMVNPVKRWLPLLDGDGRAKFDAFLRQLLKRETPDDLKAFAETSGSATSSCGQRTLRLPIC